MIERLLADTELVTLAHRLGRGVEDARETLARVAWSVLAEPGDAVAGTLVAHLGPADALRRALTSEAVPRGEGGSRALRDGRARWRPRADERVIGDALRAAARVGATLLVPGDPDWPTRLDDLDAHAPFVLWARGEISELGSSSALALVGARASTAYGESIAAEFAGDLAAAGCLIVSGGAYGIDGAAHRAAIGSGGATLAVLAGGVDRAYPSGHQQLFARVAASGAVISELPCGSAPTRWRFLSRNRLIAALGQATVVVEAGWRSGSLNTAGHAASLGRPLGAVPGPVTSGASVGCHRLLREYGAQCVTTAAEVRELLGGAPADKALSAPDDPVEVRLIDALSTRAARSPDEIAARAGFSREMTISRLGILELEGSAVRGERGWLRGAQRGHGAVR